MVIIMRLCRRLDRQVVILSCTDVRLHTTSERERDRKKSRVRKRISDIIPPIIEAYFSSHNRMTFIFLVSFDLS